MPELPEVETVARTLSPLICGRCIDACHILNPATLEGPDSLSALYGRKITSVGRRGKLLLVYVEPASSEVSGFAVHLRMTGRLFVYPAGSVVQPHTRAVFDLSDGSRMFFDDARKFGRLRVLSPASLASWPFWLKLGPEPLEIPLADFISRIRGTRRTIKTVLLDQTVIAGIGNIYADESLFRAGIHPASSAERLSSEQLSRLHKAVQQILLEAVEACGSSIRDYRTARGDVGSFQNAFKVYGRGGKKCMQCGMTLERGHVGGRGTTWCPHCQRLMTR